MGDDRDVFASDAMNGIIASMVNGQQYERLKYVAEAQGLTLSQWIARDAYKQANAMMQERDKWQ